MKFLKLSPEYECSPLWVSQDGTFYENLEVNASPFDEALKKKISKWANFFQGTLNQNYPPDSGFKSEKEEREFEQIGVSIWQEITRYYSSSFDNLSFYSYTLAKLYSDELEYRTDYTITTATKPLN
jgi:flagellar capping protein FliD